MSASAAARQNRSQLTTLVQAAEAGDFGSVEVLITAGVDVNSATEHGMTALMAAAANGHLGLVSLLLDRGADINAKRYDGLDTLALAVFFGHLHVVRELLSRGADPKAKSRFGTLPEMWATARGFHEIAQVLTEAKTATREALAHRSDKSNTPLPELTGAQEPTLSAALFSDEGLSDEILLTHNGADVLAPVITQRPRALSVEKQPSPVYSTYVAKPRYHDKRKSRKLVRCLAYITSDWQRLTLVTLIVMVLCGLGTLAFLKLLSQSKPSPATNPVNVAKPSAPDLPHFNTQNDLHSTTRAEEIRSTRAISDASGEQSIDSAKRNDDGSGRQGNRIKHPNSLPVAERPLRKSAERVTGARPKQGMTPKRETKTVSRAASTFKSAPVSAKRIPSRNAADLAEDNSAKEPPHAPPAPLSIEMQRPRSVAARNNSPAPAATRGRNTKTKVIQWP